MEDSKRITHPVHEPEVLRAMEKRGYTPRTVYMVAHEQQQQPEQISEKQGLRMVFAAIVSAVAAGVIIYSVGQRFDEASPQQAHYGAMSMPIDMTLADAPKPVSP